MSPLFALRHTAPFVPTAKPTAPPAWNSMSRKMTPGADCFSSKTPPTRLKILPFPVTYQKRSAPWYSIAVMSSVVLLATSVQIPADAGPAMAPSPSALTALDQQHPYDS